MRYVIDVLIGIGLFFAFAGVVGMLRMPDAFCRMQSSTNIATLGTLGVVLGGILYSAIFLDNWNMVIKLAVLGVFYFVTTPIGGHAIARAAYKHGVKGKNMVCDKYGEDMEE